jgi:hypothetical protein
VEPRPSSSCVVCGLSDARALVKTKLATGARVVVCANHALMHERMGGAAASVDVLLAMAREKRKPAERRESFPKDELGAMLTAGFAGERRTGTDRRG